MASTVRKTLIVRREVLKFTHIAKKWLGDDFELELAVSLSVRSDTRDDRRVNEHWKQ